MERKTLSNGLELIPVREFRGPYERVRVVEIRNRSSKSVHLDEGTMESPASQWIYLQRTEVAPKEKTLLVIGEAV